MSWGNFFASTHVVFCLIVKNLSLGQHDFRRGECLYGPFYLQDSTGELSAHHTFLNEDLSSVLEFFFENLREFVFGFYLIEGDTGSFIFWLNNAGECDREMMDFRYVRDNE